MAERKTFLFFCGWAEVLADFTPQDRCAVYDAVIAYAENGTLPDNLSPEQKMAFKFIRKDIDEMQVKYEKVCEKRREYGRRGGLANAAKRKQNEQMLQIVAKDSKSEQNVANQAKHKHKHKHEHEHEEDKDKSLPSPPATQDNACVRESGQGGGGEAFLSEYFAPERRSSLEQLCMSLHTTEDNLRRLAQECVMEWEMEKTDFTAKSFSDLARRLLIHVRAKLNAEKRSTRQNSPQAPAQPDGLGVGEYIAPNGRRTYANGSASVPMDAPPRPGSQYWWSEASNAWVDIL